jgi:hypothetical protein
VVNAETWWDSLVRDRFRAVLELTLDAISDDYATVDIIVQTVNEWDEGSRSDAWEAREAVPVSRPEVVRALKELTREGFVQAYLLSDSETLPVELDSARIGDFWFYPTRRGMNALKRISNRD